MLYNTKRYASYRTRCQFSKKIIEKGTIISLFTLYDYNKFVEIVKNSLITIFPEEIVDFIIEKTGYERYINYWGLSKYVEFKPEIHRLTYKYNKIHENDEIDCIDENYEIYVLLNE